MEKLEEKFNENLEKWRKHCLDTINSSNPKDYINCQAYKEIIALGNKALPLIKKAFDTEPKIDSFNPYSLKSHLFSAVKGIVGNDLKLPQEIRGKVFEVADYTQNWLDENMNQYLKR